MSIPLSTDAWPMFFEERHHALSRSLREHKKSIESFTKDHKGQQTAQDMGHLLDVYRYVCPRQEPFDLRSIALIREALSYESPMADSIFAVQGLGTYPISVFGNTAQKLMLDDFISGNKIAGFALTEPEAGSDVASIATLAHKNQNGYVLTGHKVFISNATIADQFVVFATIDSNLGKKGLAAFLVPSKTPGLKIKETTLGIDHPVGELLFDKCQIGVDALLGEEGQGFSIAMTTLSKFRVSVGAAAIGMARRAFDEATDHVCQRVQFGKPLAAQQLVKGYLADMATQIDASIGLVLKAAFEADTSETDITLSAAKAKLFATEAAFEVIDKAVQLFGGQGVTRGNKAEELYRAIRPLRIYEGTSEIQKLIIGAHVTRERL